MIQVREADSGSLTTRQAMLSHAVLSSGALRPVRGGPRHPGASARDRASVRVRRAVRGRTNTPEGAHISTSHLPVLLTEVVDAFAPVIGGVILDGTFGAGGYTTALLGADPARRVLALDRDPDAVAAGQGAVAAWDGRLTLRRGRFGELEAALGEGEKLDGIVLDIGVSSMQLDRAERGFSFRQDGPLDMRMERDGPSAADLVNELDETELANIIYRYGEERRSRAIARAVVERRRTEPFRTTLDLAQLVARHVRTEPGINPATRTFQALRIAVNDELGELERALAAAERVLRPGGRLAVVTFHSLEDRLVKHFIQARTDRGAQSSRHLPATARSQPTFVAATKGALSAGEAEIRRNPRARSAKLRVAERTDSPPAEGAR